MTSMPVAAHNPRMNVAKLSAVLWWIATIAITISIVLIHTVASSDNEIVVFGLNVIYMVASLAAFVASVVALFKTQGMARYGVSALLLLTASHVVFYMVTALTNIDIQAAQIASWATHIVLLIAATVLIYREQAR